jgi:dipeptidyl aminopeptidase/acylaminoacyl peptidase
MAGFHRRSAEGPGTAEEPLPAGATAAPRTGTGDQLVQSTPREEDIRVDTHGPVGLAASLTFAATAGNNNGEIYAVNVDGSGRTRLTNIPGHDHWPLAWSSDGTRITFTSEGTENDSEIYGKHAG